MHIFNKIVKIIILFQIIFAIPIQQVYDNAEPFGIFDKYLILQHDEVYTGTIGIYEGNIFIEGNGAVLDLVNGLGIWVYSSQEPPVNLNIEYLNIINGSEYGITFMGNSTGNIENCNFVNNDFGLKIFDTVNVQVKNSNFIGCSTYAFGLWGNPITQEIDAEIDVQYCNFWNNINGDLQENCPG